MMLHPARFALGAPFVSVDELVVARVSRQYLWIVGFENAVADP
jgi:hypothetical protein